MEQLLPKVPTALLINGKWLETETSAPVYNPASGEILTMVSQGGVKETRLAINAAEKAFHFWSETTPKERTDYLNKIAAIIEEEVDTLAKILTMEQGKPLDEATAEILTDAENFRWNAAQAQRIEGEIVPSPKNQHWLVQKQPIGVVGAITPWNFPSNMIARKIAPAIAAGCTIVLKPSKETPLSALALGDIFIQAGLPAGVVNIILGDSSEIGKELTTNPKVKKITFTGSTEIGKQLYEQAAPSLKKVSLELGGHAPFIVFEDADIPVAVDKLVAAKFRNNGQVCTAPNRIFLHDAIKEDFTAQLLKKMPTITVGNGLKNPTIGPLINEQGLRKIKKQLADAQEKGAKILFGGHQLTGGTYTHGIFFEPTVIDHITNDMAIFYEETFGPVIPLLSFHDREMVINAANDTEFGLAAYFFSQNLQTISEVSRKLQYGMIGVNEMAISNSAVPFGGVKHSGFGRENGKYGPEEYVEVKFVSINAT